MGERTVVDRGFVAISPDGYASGFVSMTERASWGRLHSRWGSYSTENQDAKIAAKKAEGWRVVPVEVVTVADTEGSQE